MATDFKTTSIQVGNIQKAIAETITGELIFTDTHFPQGIVLKDLVSETQDIVDEVNTQLAAITATMLVTITQNVSAGIITNNELIYSISASVDASIAAISASIPSFTDLAKRTSEDNTFITRNIFATDTFFMDSIGVGASGTNPEAGVAVQGKLLTGSANLTATGLSLIITTTGNAFADVNVGTELVINGVSYWVNSKISDNSVVTNALVPAITTSFTYRKPLARFVPSDIQGTVDISAATVVGTQGYIGIRTTTPLASLHIKGSELVPVSGYANIFIESNDGRILMGNAINNTDYGLIRYTGIASQKELLIGSYLMNRGADIVIDAVDPLYPNANYPSGFIAFRTSKYTESVVQPDMVEVARITNLGNFGINTTTPTAYLHVTNVTGSNTTNILSIDVNDISRLKVDISGNTIVQGDGIASSQLTIINNSGIANSTSSLLYAISGTSTARILSQTQDISGGALFLQTRNLSGGWNNALVAADNGSVFVNVTTDITAATAAYPSYNLAVLGNEIVTGKLDADNINVKSYTGVINKQVVDSVNALVADWSVLVRDTASNAYFASSVKALSGNVVPDYTVYSVLGTHGLSPDFGVEMSGANMNLYVDYPNTYNAKSTRINIDTLGI